MPNIEIITRAVILDRGKILICKNKRNDYYFLPGGHVEFGETAQQALGRELKEELNIEADTIEYIGTVENMFSENGNRHHEINLVFAVKPQNHSSASIENHIEFFWIGTNKLAGENVEPIALKNAVLKWLINKKLFWESERE